MNSTDLIPPETGSPSDSNPSNKSHSASFNELLEVQLSLVKSIQERLSLPGIEETLTTREYKDLLFAASNSLSVAHRTDQMQRDLRTYQLFVDLILDFLEKRSDTLGADLLAELRKTASTPSSAEAAHLILKSRQARNDVSIP